MEVPPNYKESVYNIPYTILHMLGMENNNVLKNFRDLKGDRIFFILIDALGFDLFKTHIKNKLNCEYSKITSIFPSTTAAALTTIYTGLTPKQHGILEWYMYYEKYGNIIKTLPFTPINSSENDYLIKLGFSPQSIFSFPTIFEKIKNGGLMSSTYLREEYAFSSYSLSLFKGSKIFPYKRLDLAFKLIETSKANLTTIYIDYIDTIQHRYGPYSKEVELEIKKILKYLISLKQKTKNAIIIVSADHGQIEIKKKKILKIGSRKIKIGGSPRDVFVYSKEKISEDLKIIEKNLILSLLGPGEENFALQKRVPNYIILPPDFEGVWFEDFNFKGLHGGLSKSEMYVPFIIIQN